MTIPTTTLQTYSTDRRAFVYDFSQMDEIAGGDTISSVTSITASPSGLTIGSNEIVGGTVEVVLSGGASGTTYTVTCIIQTSSGAILTGIGQLAVN
jgi:hypothetical protein